MQGKIIITFDTATHGATVDAGKLDALTVALIVSQVVPVYLQQIMAANALTLPFDPRVPIVGPGPGKS